MARCARKRQTHAALPLPIRHAESRGHIQLVLCRPPERFYSSRNRRRGPGWHCTPVVSHVRLHQMSGCQSTTQAQLSGQDSRANDSSQPPCILARCGGVRTTHSEHVEHGRLSFENGTATDGADFNARHGHTDLKISIQTSQC